MNKTTTVPANHRSLSEIAAQIKRDFRPMYFGAKPYVDAMATLDKMTDNYFQDSAKSIVAYFLGNAGSWRGDVARCVKKELNDMLKGK